MNKVAIGLSVGIVYATALAVFSTLTIPQGGWGAWLIVAPVDLMLAWGIRELRGAS